MIRAVLVSGAVGFAFLIALGLRDQQQGRDASAAPVAFIVNDVLGGVVQKIFLVFVCVSIFACGMIIMVTNSRLICVHGAGPAAARPPALQPGAAGDRRPVLGDLLAAVLGA